MANDASQGRATIDVTHTKPLVGVEALKNVGDSYLQQFVGLREINELVDESKDRHRRKFAKANPEELLGKEDFEQFKKLAIELAKGLAAVGKRELRDPESGDRVPLPEVGPEGFRIAIESPEVAAAMTDIVSREIVLHLAPKRSEIIAQSLIANIASAFEVLMGSVAQEVFKINKSALQKTDHEFTLEELINYDSIDEARDELVSRRIEALLMKSVDEWSKWCEKTLQFGLPALTSDWKTVREVFARRNIIVHNGGIVNRRYLNIVKECGISLPPDVAVGTSVITTKKYVNSAIQLVLSLGLSLVYSTCKKLFPKTEPDTVDWLVSRQKFMLYEEMWLAVEEITARIKGSKAKRSSQCMADVYGWVARKELYGSESIREEVERWDVSGLNVQYAIYKKLLIGDLESAGRMIRENEGRPPFTKYEISVDPIFIELRAAGQVQQQSAAPTNSS